LKSKNNNINDDWKKIKLNNISYTYPKENEYRFNVGPINLEINRGEVIFLIGGNGSGKSTFAKLLCGLYTPNTGTIHVDDVLIEDNVNNISYKDQFSTIFSDFYLFKQVLTKDGVLAEDSVVNEQISRMKLSESVTTQNGILSSVNLSQGQKKRLALAVSFIEDSTICIYDEWAADQDPEFRKLFYTEILPELKSQGKTLIVITHDDRYFDLSDRLLKFESGQLLVNS